MRIATVALSALMAWALATSSAQGAERLKLGEKAPMANVKMKNVDGKEVSIADVAGKNGTLVIFSCNHCPFVKAWETRVAEIGNGALKEGIGVIQINSNDPTVQPPDGYDEMQKRAKDRGFRFPYVVDANSDVARAFGATRTPECFLFDKDGKLVYWGAIDDNHKDAKSVDKHYLQDAINAMLAGKPIPVAETKAVGCTIKWRAKA